MTKSLITFVTLGLLWSCALLAEQDLGDPCPPCDAQWQGADLIPNANGNSNGCNYRQEKSMSNARKTNYAGTETTAYWVVHKRPLAAVNPDCSWHEAGKYHRTEESYQEVDPTQPGFLSKARVIEIKSDQTVDYELGYGQPKIGVRTRDYHYSERVGAPIGAPFIFDDMMVTLNEATYDTGTSMKDKIRDANGDHDLHSYELRTVANKKNGSLLATFPIDDNSYVEANLHDVDSVDTDFNRKCRGQYNAIPLTTTWSLTGSCDDSNPFPGGPSHLDVNVPPIDPDHILAYQRWSGQFGSLGSLVSQRPWSLELIDFGALGVFLDYMVGH